MKRLHVHVSVENQASSVRPIDARASRTRFGAVNSTLMPLSFRSPSDNPRGRPRSRDLPPAPDRERRRGPRARPRR
jgi:hypothetical protein